VFFAFLVSVCCLTLVVTGSCARVLFEVYEEGCAALLVADEWEQQHSLFDAEEESGVGDDDAFWNPHDEVGHQSNNHNNSNYGANEHTSSTHQPFHIQLAFRTVSNLPIEVALGLFSLLCAWSLTSLTCFHALIITLAQTTNERVRGVYQYGGIRNPADEGCWRNWTGVFCAKVPRSRLPKDFSEAVTLPRAPGGECGGDDDGSDAEGPCRLVGEETLWPGWQYSQSFTGLISAPAISSTMKGQS